MEHIKKTLKSPANVTTISSLLQKVTKDQFIIAKLKGNALQNIHILTHIPNKNPFITENMKEDKILLLVRYRDIGAYIHLTKTLDVAENLGDVSTWKTEE